MPNTYIVFTGGRDFDDGEWVDEVMQLLVWLYGDSLRVIQGKARGADALVREACQRFGVRFRDFAVTNEDWKRAPKAAGHIRNAQMADWLVVKRQEGHYVQCIAFPGGGGTSSMMAMCEQRQISVSSL